MDGFLPSNPVILSGWAKQHGVDVNRPFSLLATEVGSDCAGAVQFVPGEQEAQLAVVTGPRVLTVGTRTYELRPLRAPTPTRALTSCGPNTWPLIYALLTPLNKRKRKAQPYGHHSLISGTRPSAAQGQAHLGAALCRWLTGSWSGGGSL